MPAADSLNGARGQFRTSRSTQTRKPVLQSPIHTTSILAMDLARPARGSRLAERALALPAWAAIVAIADQGLAINGLGSLDGASQLLPEIYSMPASNFHDITSGNNGTFAQPPATTW